MRSSSNSGRNGRSHPAIGRPAAIHVAARYHAAPERVFNAWLDPDVARRWLFATATRPIAHVEIDARVAGLFRFAERHELDGVEHGGEYVEIVPHNRLVFSLALADRPRVVTRVSVEIEPRATGCTLALTHENVPVDLVRGTEARWIGMLYGLGVTLDSFVADPMPKRRHVAPDVALRRLALAQAGGRGEPQPPRNPRSE